MSESPEIIAARLMAIFKRQPLGQAEFGAAYGLGTQGNVGHYLKARRPLSLEAALKFLSGFEAQGLQVTLAEISPELEAKRNRIVAGAVVEPHRPAGVTAGDEQDDPGYDGTLTREELRDLAAKSGMLDPGTLVIQQLDVRGSMGYGAELQEHVDVVRTVRVSLPELRRQVPNFTAPENLRILTGLGDSMRPTFTDGDPLLVDIGVTEITVDGVYVLEKDDQLYVKRMQRRLIDGSLLMISDNKDYGSELITNGDRQKFAVRGRVLLAWNARRM